MSQRPLLSVIAPLIAGVLTHDDHLAAVACPDGAGVTAEVTRRTTAKIVDRQTPYETLLAYSWSGFRISFCEVQPLEVGGPGPVQRLAGPPGAGAGSG